MIADDLITDDAVLDGRLRLLQSRRGLRAGMDAILLAAAVPVAEDSDCQVLDAGTGSGVVGLSVLARCPQARLTGIDCDQELVALAAENAGRNDLAARAQFMTGDILLGGSALGRIGLGPNSFDHVVANPPFFESGTVRRAPEPQKDRANVMASGDLEQWVRFLVSAARAGGTMTMIHTADALGAVLEAIGTRFGGLRIYPLFPRAGEPASRILVQGRKGARSPLVLLPGLVLHEADGRFTPEAQAVLRDGVALVL